MSLHGFLHYFENEHRLAQNNQEMLEKILDKVTIQENMIKSQESKISGYYTIKELAEKLNISVSTIYSEIKKDHFPKQVKIGERASGWCKKEFAAWMAINTKKGRNYIERKKWSNIYTERYGVKNKN